MNKSKFASIVLALLILVGCQSVPQNKAVGPISYSGETHADSELTANTTKMVQSFVAGLGCDVVEHINTKVFFYEPSNGTKDHVWGKEGWMATGCGRPFPIFVTFKEDGLGGTFFELSTK